MVQKDSPESGKHFKYLQTVSEMSRKVFQTHFQKSYFFEKALFFQTKIGQMVEKKKIFRKHMIFENESEKLF